ncbi:MAG: carboxylating nicotinate-nucleotide diphosphorylase [Candidatus Anammoxibacter sp.]
MKLDKRKFEELVEFAIKEDIGNGDITTNCTIPDNLIISANFIANEPGIIAGLPIVDHIFAKYSGKVCFEVVVEEGNSVTTGDLIARIKGNARIILSNERVSLNFLQRMSGIATLTSMYVKKVSNQGIKIVDTRKTTPGWRYIEKYAVTVGGGYNHRIGLFDQVLIKDNHLIILNSCISSNKEDNAQPETEENLIINTVHSVRKQIPESMLIEIEIDQTDNVKDALESGVDIIMFDNMDSNQITTALQIVRDWLLETKRKRPLIEVSGGVTLKNIDKIAQAGVDRIAIGAITHSVMACDISLEIDNCRL